MSTARMELLKELDAMPGYRRPQAIANAVVNGDIKTRKLFDQILASQQYWEEDEYTVLQHIPTLPILMTLYKWGELSDDRVKSFCRRAGELTETFDDIVMVLKQLTAGAMHFAYLCSVEKYKKIWSFITSYEDYLKMYKLVDPAWRDRIIGVEMEYAVGNPVFDYLAPDVTGERFWYIRYIIFGGKATGLLTKAVANVAQLAELLAYIPVRLYPNYVIWHTNYFADAGNLEFILKRLSYARACELIRGLTYRHLETAFHSPALLASFGKQLEAKKQCLLLNRYQSLRDQELNPQRNIPIFALANLFNKKYKESLNKLAIDETKISQEAALTENAQQLVMWLKEHNAAEQYFYLGSLEGRLFQMVGLDYYKAVREALAVGETLDREFIRHASGNPRVLAVALQCVLSFNEEFTINGLSEAHLSFWLRAAITAAVDSMDTADKLSELLSNVDAALRGMVLQMTRLRLFKLVQCRADYERLALAGGESFKRCFKSEVLTVERLATYYHVLPVVDVKQVAVNEEGKPNFPEQWGKWLQVKENLIYFLRRQTPERCMTFMGAMYAFLTRAYNDYSFYDVCQAVSKQKGYVLFQYFTSLARPAPSALLVWTNWMRGRAKPDKETLKPVVNEPTPVCPE